MGFLQDGTVQKRDRNIIVNPRGVDPLGWNPADQSSNGTLMIVSQLNRQAQSLSAPAASRAIRGATFRNSGSRYFEVTVTGGSSIDAATPAIGIAPPTGDLSAVRIGNPGASGNVFLNGNGNLVRASSVAYGLSIANQTVMVAWNADLGHIWFGRAGTWFAGGDPAADLNPAATGVLGNHAPVFGASNAFVITALLRNRAGSFLFTPPTGFGDWS